MSTFTGIANAVLIVVLSYGVWKILKRKAALSTINKIPGPKAQSWFKGNFSDVFGLESWSFHDMMRETCLFIYRREAAKNVNAAL
ncbi:hypothetical protein VNI00_010578 [Paramarasmius palmivorus]|uniref:Uncharacterized protein n=1 Tax=Paramarasmius palmivorus TaxID=297713 RepID=A0AAW0CJ14_9AGAR